MNSGMPPNVKCPHVHMCQIFWEWDVISNSQWQLITLLVGLTDTDQVIQPYVRYSHLFEYDENHML